MQHPDRSRLFTVFLTALAVLLFACTGLAQSNLVYVETNTGTCPGCGSNHNAVLAFTNDGTGRLKPVTGSPFKTGGTGLYDPNVNPASVDIDEDYEVVVSPDGAFLFAVNMTSNTIASFSINADGSLTAVPGSPFPSNGTQPASLGLLWHSLPNNGSILVVANKASDPNQQVAAPNYSTFTVDANGVLTLNTAATVTLPIGASPSNVLISNKGSLMFGVQFLGSGDAVLGSYRIKSDGSLTLQNSLNPPSPGMLFLGIAQHPVNSALYVGLPDLSKLSVYQFGATSGLLSFNKTVGNSGSLICWITTNKTGTRVYTGETGSDTVGVYDTTSVLTPVQLQEFAVRSGGSFAVTNLAVDPTGKFLYVLTGNELHVLTISDTDGTLSEIAPPRPLNLKTGTVAVGLATLMK